ncbi:MAG TPA: hypothetical protein VNA15_12680 [Candidatus Angelobacter sp.]|nr:hypothetical protein [Candidatus Angelobacter sp.]
MVLDSVSAKESVKLIGVIEDLSGFLGESPSSSNYDYTSRKMLQTETRQAARKSFSTRSLVLVILLVGLGTGITAYVLATASAAPTTSSNQNGPDTYNGQWPGLRRAGPLAWETGHNGTFTSFRAASTIANVSITGFNIVDSSHLTVTLSYQGTGTTTAATIVVAGPGLSGSNTVSA